MTRHWIMAAAVALVGCGTRSSLDAPPQKAGPEPAELVHDCDKLLHINVGAADCQHLGPGLPNILPAYLFYFNGIDPAELHSGAVLELSPPGKGGPTSVLGFMTPANVTQPLVQLTGTVELTTFDADKGGTGSFHVSYSGGKASGTFSAGVCTAVCPK